jgi:hypothetical protein
MAWDAAANVDLYSPRFLVIPVKEQVEAAKSESSFTGSGVGIRFGAILSTRAIGLRSSLPLLRACG